MIKIGENPPTPFSYFLYGTAKTFGGLRVKQLISCTHCHSVLVGNVGRQYLLLTRIRRKIHSLRTLQHTCHGKLVILDLKICTIERL